MLKNFKGEGVSAVFIPCALEKDASMYTASERAEVVSPANAEINRAADVNLAALEVLYFVDAACGHDRHFNLRHR